MHESSLPDLTLTIKVNKASIARFSFSSILVPDGSFVISIAPCYKACAFGWPRKLSFLTALSQYHDNLLPEPFFTDCSGGGS